MAQEDPIVEQFITVHGVRDLLENMNYEKITSMGQYYMALCKFHDNTRLPDFQMHKTLGLFNCFGCGAKGNLYQFMMMSYNITYDQAKEMVMKLAGFDANVDIEALQWGAQIRNMISEDKEKEIRPSRQVKLTPEIIAQFNTGPDPYNYLSSRGFTDETIAYFECTFTNKWKIWDDNKKEERFEERVVIPGHLPNGELKGFIGRTPIGDEPKYRYTAGYQKSLHLFNLHRAESSKGLILVEGPADAMQLHNIGFPNVVAIYGASLSEEQSKLIRDKTDRVWLSFDNDQAGRNAIKRAVDLLKDEVDVNIVNLSPFKDPGEINNKNEFQAMINASLNWNQFNFKLPF